MGLNDIYVPEPLYKATIKDLEDKLKEIRTASGPVVIRGVAYDKKDVRTFETKIRSLKNELDSQKRRVEHVLARMDREKNAFFAPAQ